MTFTTHTYPCGLCKKKGFTSEEVLLLNHGSAIVCKSCVEKYPDSQLAIELLQIAKPSIFTNKLPTLEQVKVNLERELHPFVPKVTDPRGWLTHEMECEYNQKHGLVFGYDHDWLADEIDVHNIAFLKRHPNWIKENPTAEVEVSQ